MERWKDIIEYEGLYQVSDRERVRSMDRVVTDRRGNTRKLKGRILSPTLVIEDGVARYVSVKVWKEGAQKTKKLHRIVLEAFVGPCPDGQEGCHNDGNAANNTISNLRWDTSSNNSFDKRRHGTHGGRRVRRSDGVEFINLHVAAEKTSCNHTQIWAVCNGTRKTTGGYGWEYVEISI